MSDSVGFSLLYNSNTMIHPGYRSHYWGDCLIILNNRNSKKDDYNVIGYLTTWVLDTTSK